MDSLPAELKALVLEYCAAYSTDTLLALSYTSRSLRIAYIENHRRLLLRAFLHQIPSLLHIFALTLGTVDSSLEDLGLNYNFRKVTNETLQASVSYFKDCLAGFEDNFPSSALSTPQLKRALQAHARVHQLAIYATNRFAANTSPIVDTYSCLKALPGLPWGREPSDWYHCIYYFLLGVSVPGARARLKATWDLPENSWLIIERAWEDGTPIQSVKAEARESAFFTLMEDAVVWALWDNRDTVTALLKTFREEMKVSDSLPCETETPVDMWKIVTKVLLVNPLTLFRFEGAAYWWNFACDVAVEKNEDRKRGLIVWWLMKRWMKVYGPEERRDGVEGKGDGGGADSEDLALWIVSLFSGSRSESENGMKVRLQTSYEL